jgi:hypothetical protein
MNESRVERLVRRTSFGAVASPMFDFMRVFGARALSYIRKRSIWGCDTAPEIAAVSVWR